MFKVSTLKTEFLVLLLSMISPIAQSKDINKPALMVPPDSRPFIYENSPKMGIYDPSGALATDQYISIDNYFISLVDFNTDSFWQLQERSKQAGREILLTVEPRSWNKTQNGPDAPLLMYKDIMNGNMDDEINNVCKVIGKSTVPITVRWAQEMEDPSGPYIWNKWSSSQYKTVYNKFVSMCRINSKNAKFMWSPKGSIGKHDAFYPGDKFVDVIGVSLFGFQDFDRKYFKKDRGFVETFTPTYNAFRKYNKPLWAAEFAYYGDQKYVERWQQESMARHKEFPNLSAVIYFNAPEGTAWPDGWKPDWRIGSNISKK